MTAYVIVQGEVTDPEQYERYKGAAAASVTNAGGRYIVRGSPPEPLEGDLPPARTVMLEFPSIEAAQRWYRGAEYGEAKRLREGAANLRFYLIDGVE